MRHTRSYANIKCAIYKETNSCKLLNARPVEMRASFHIISFTVIPHWWLALALNVHQSTTKLSLQQMETRSLKEIVDGFQPSKFSPSGMAQNCHWQTIVGTGALKAKFFGPPERTFQVTTERFHTFDGDFFDVEYTEGFDAPEADRSVIILHGLESTTKGSLVTSYTKSFLNKGFSCCLVSFRSCNGEENL